MFNPYKFPLQEVFPTTEQLWNVSIDRFKSMYYSYIANMIDLFSSKLNNPIYLSLMNDFDRSNESFQEELVKLVSQYDPITNPVRVQMVTCSGNVFADSLYPADYGNVSPQEVNLYNNPEIAQALLSGIGGIRRCFDGKTQTLHMCIGCENKYGTIVLTRLIYYVPE
jgi:hypothetical protein